MDGSVAVYYEKTPYDNGRNEVVGLFGIKVNKEFAKSADEKQFANKNATVRYISYNEGVYVFEYNKMYIPEIIVRISVIFLRRLCVINGH